MPSRRAMVPRPLPGIEAWVTRRILLAGLLLALSLPAPQATTAQSAAAARPLPRLRVSENHRFLVTEKDDPFFWLGDTAWEMLPPARLARRPSAICRTARSWASRWSRRSRSPSSTACTRRTRMAPRRCTDDDPTQPNEAYFTARGLDCPPRQRARSLCRLPADVGRQVEHQARRRPRDLQRRRTPSSTARGWGAATRMTA